MQDLLVHLNFCLHNACNRNEPLTSVLSSLLQNRASQHLLCARTNEHKCLAQAAVVDFKLLEVMTLEAQTQDQKLQRKRIHSRLLGRTLASFMPNSKNLPCWMCGNVCIKSSSCSCRSLNLLHFFRCALQALSSQILKLIGFQRINRTKCVRPLTSFAFAVSHTSCVH